MNKQNQKGKFFPLKQKKWKIISIMKYLQDKELDEVRRNLDVKLDDSKVKMLQTTIQNLTSEVRELKKKNEELEKQLLDIPKQLGDIPAKFHGSSNLNDDLYK